MTSGDIGLAIGLMIKIFVIFGAILYSLFAFIIIRQEQLMSRVFMDDTEPVVRMITYIHLVAAISVIFLSFILL